MATPKMLPGPKALVLEALRSDEYLQSQGSLRRGEGFCCLGVFCEVAIKNGVEIKVTKKEEFESWDYDDERNYLPTSVENWLFGSGDAPDDAFNPVVFDSDSNRERPLAALNDDGVPFRRIADLVEEQL